MNEGKQTSQPRDAGLDFQPKFGSDGLITAVVSDHKSGEPLMVAHMDSEALETTLKTGQAHFFSRSRKSLWHKGGTSGNVLKVHEILIDCDQDCIWLKAEPMRHGAACHTGRRSCFYRKVQLTDGTIVLQDTGDEPLFDPQKT